MTGKLRVDMAMLSFRQLDEANQVVFENLGVPLSEAMTGPRQQYAAAVLAWVALRRDQPELTLDEALDMPMGSIEMVNPSADPEAPAASNGGEPQLSPAPGV